MESAPGCATAQRREFRGACAHNQRQLGISAGGREDVAGRRIRPGSRGVDQPWDFNLAPACAFFARREISGKWAADLLSVSNSTGFLAYFFLGKK